MCYSLLKRVFEKLGDIFDENTRKAKLMGISKIAAAGFFTSNKDKAHWTELSSICTYLKPNFEYFIKMRHDNYISTQIQVVLDLCEASNVWIQTPKIV